jgi:hypothetical protein
MEHDRPAERDLREGKDALLAIEILEVGQRVADYVDEPRRHVERQAEGSKEC